MTGIKEKPEILLFSPEKGITAYLLRGEFISRNDQRGAVLSILKTVLGDGIQLLHDSEGAPILPPGMPNISVSHCRKAVAVALSPERYVGVDIEPWNDRLRKVAPRFLFTSEKMFFSSSQPDLLRAWTFKEAVYKLLHFSPYPPVVLTAVSLFDSRVSSATLHIDDMALTVAWNRESF